MKRILNHLIQLQDLCLTRKEQETLVPERELSELDASIKELKAELPKRYFRKFETLQKRYQAAVVPVFEGACSGCGAVLPTAIGQKIISGDELIQCPMCSRILYSYKGPKKRIQKSPEFILDSSIGVSRFSSELLMIPALDAENKKEAIKELVHLMADNEFIDQPEEVIESSLRREAMLTTAVGSGLAFPHVRGIECCGLTLAVGLKEAGLDWNTPDGKPVQIVSFMVIPIAASAFYLELVSGLMKTFRDKDNYESLINSETKTEMWENLIDLTEGNVY
jgi:PTS system nitrogen regulatory IIA component